MNHTPGPWMVRENPDKTPAYTFEKHLIVMDSRQFYMASIHADASVDDVVDNEEQLSNARLIAAAPDLLESVRDMVTILSQIQNLLAGYLVPDSLEDQDDCINGILSIADHKETLQKQRKALKAIAKAEGKGML